MNETGLWHYLRGGMGARWHATRIESSAGNGTPDVTFGLQSKQGFLELKYIKAWPKRLSTPVKLPLRPEQKLWIEARGKLSGNVWVLTRIEDDFILLDWYDSLLACKGMTKDEWLCGAYWHKRIYFDHFYQRLWEGE